MTPNPSSLLTTRNRCLKLQSIWLVTGALALGLLASWPWALCWALGGLCGLFLLWSQAQTAKTLLLAQPKTSWAMAIAHGLARYGLVAGALVACQPLAPAGAGVALGGCLGYILCLLASATWARS